MSPFVSATRALGFRLLARRGATWEGEAPAEPRTAVRVDRAYRGRCAARQEPRPLQTAARRIYTASAFLIFAALAAAPAEPTAPGRLGAASKTPPGILANVGFDQNLGDQIPLDLTFRDETGQTVTLGDFFGKKPVIVTLNYYECPMLCTLELNALARSLKPITFDAGKEFEIVTVSIDPRETPALAAAKKRGYLARYGRKGAENGWHFLTGEQDSITRLAKAVGFRYAYDEKSGQYAHAAGVTVVTPEGKIARYFYGLDYPAKDLRLGLVEASEGKIGNPIDQLLLFCFHYDPSTGKYNFVVMSVLRVLGVVTAAGLGTFMFVTVRREKRVTQQETL